MSDTAAQSVPPSDHARSLAGVDLPAASPPTVRVEAVREVVVVVSRSRDPRREVHIDRCWADRVPVVVRPSGGGAVVLAPGVVAASVLAETAAAGPFPEPYFRLFGDAVARALSTLGIAGAVMRGVSDICLGERKVAGSALRVWRERVLYQVSLLVEVDVGLMERYLPPPSRQPDYRRDRPHREFVITLREAGSRASLASITGALETEFAAEVARLRHGGASV